MAGSPSISIDALLAHSSWLRRLASHLVSDPDQADDLVHETWALALENPPASGIDPRRWLARVMRNRAKNRYRKADVQQWHEKNASRAAEWSPAEIEQRVGLQKQVAEAVLGLEEPYRTSITLHYFEDQSADEIAQRQGTSAVNVRKQLSRGREMLRARLDRDFGGRDAWCLVFLEMLRKGAAAPVAASTAKTVALTSLAAALAILSLFVWSRVRSPGETHNELAARVAEVETNGRSRDRSEPPTDSTPGLREALGGPIRKVDPDHEIRGVVTGAGDLPVRGATIAVFKDEASGYAWDWDSDAEPVRSRIAATESDAQGKFAVEVPPGRPFELEASAEGYATRTLGYRYAGEGVKFQLGAGAVIEGRVTRDPGGAPLAGARLEITTTSGTLDGERLLIRKGETDEAGRFRFDNLPGDTVSVRLTPRSQGAPASRAITIEPGRTSVVDFAVKDGGTISGRVLDADTLEPITNATVGESMKFHRVGRVDEHGNYSYSGVRDPGAGSVVLVARAPGYSTEVRVFRVSADVDDLPERWDFHLTRGVLVRGLVVDSQGRPVKDAYVAAISDRAIDPSIAEAVRIRGRTDDRGRFELPDASRDLAFTLFARHEGSGTLVRPCRATSSGAGVVDVETLVLPVSSSLRGSVLDEEGHPVPNWTVNLIPEGEEAQEADAPLPMSVPRWLARRSAKTDDRGRFAFVDVGADEYTLSVVNPDSNKPYWKRVSIASGQAIEDANLVLGQGGTIEGRLVDRDGRGLAGIRVRAVHDSDRGAYGTRSGEDGNFTVKSLPPGVYSLEVNPTIANQGPSFLRLQRSGVRPGAKNLVLPLETAGILRGRVLDADGRPSAESAVVAAVPGRDEEFSGYTNPDGTFAIAVPVDASLELRGYPRDFEGKPLSKFTDEDLARIARKQLPTIPDSEVILQLPR